ncbi:Protein sel-1 like protein 2 [Melipona quadrifasciata]|uniref:Protein sel-1 like protein 2 n=1 Tax=Melipona quadrifasciata TaxID=166423 RepID=A0A0M8ZZ21_9HYME|nr:Protein sel-1 like protein 2 [Melipona quadrifasciata]
MWKLVARGIRETLERRACRTNVYYQTSQEPNTKNEVKTSLTCNHKFLPPTFSVFNKEFFGSTKTSGTKDKDHDSKWNTKYTWSEAIGLTSALALGWVVCQTLCLRRFFEKEKTDSLKNKLLQVPHTSYLIDQALKEATEEFTNTHKLAVAEFELQYGLKALEEERYKDAIKHFTVGANLSSAASMFNLGLCHELGLGTLVDHRQAAKYYNDAAKQGHADATYNLGVFYAQGRGDFTVDIDRARNYFIKAAKLGQSQAQHALELEKHYQVKQKEIDTILPDEHKSILHYMRNQNMNHILKKLINYNNVSYTQSETEFLEDHKECMIKCKNTVELVLNMFGLGKSNILPVSVESNNCSVSC